MSLHLRRFEFEFEFPWGRVAIVNDNNSDGVGKDGCDLRLSCPVGKTELKSIPLLNDSLTSVDLFIKQNIKPESVPQARA